MNARFDDAGTRSTPLRDQLVCLIRDLRASLVARIDVAKVEVRASAREIVVGTVALAATILFAMGAWFTICALAVYALVAAAHVSWLVALSIVAVANVVLAVGAVTIARRHMEHVSLSHTRQAFLGRPHVGDEVLNLKPGSVVSPAGQPPPAAESTLQGIQHGAT